MNIVVKIEACGLDKYGIKINDVVLMNFINDSDMRIVLYALEQILVVVKRDDKIKDHSKDYDYNIEKSA